MTTHLQYGTGKLSRIITAHPRFSPLNPELPFYPIVHSVKEAILIVDARRRIVLLNNKAELIFGRTAEEMLEKPLAKLIPARTINGLRRHFHQLPAGVDRLVKKGRRALKGVNANGQKLWLEASIVPIKAHGEMLMALILHATKLSTPQKEERNPTEDIWALRRLAVSSQQATEVEKRRFSKKLYDDIAQRLSVLKLDLDWLENSLSNTEKPVPERVAQMQGQLDHVIRMTKSMASALRPPLLDDFGLLPAVEWMAQSFQKRTRIKCTVESHGMNIRLDEATESLLFRVIQEGLSNIEHHANARNALITFIHAHGQLDVMIRDDGTGMINGSERKAGCYGLSAMRERISVLGGTISIRNTHPHGVTIHASVPIKP